MKRGSNAMSAADYATSDQYWGELMAGNQDYLDNQNDPKGFWDTSNHLGTLHNNTAEAIEVYDARYPWSAES